VMLIMAEAEFVHRKIPISKIYTAFLYIFIFL